MRLNPFANLVGASQVADWVVSQSLGRNLLFTVLFMFLTIFIIRKGVEDGIEKWSKRLMPMMIGLLILLIIYVFTLDGASEGIEAYLNPDISRVLDPNLFGKCVRAGVLFTVIRYQCNGDLRFVH